MKRRDFIMLFGAATAWPLAARAQQKTTPLIGILIGASPGGLYEARLAAIRLGLSETGYIEGQNVAMEPLYAESHYDRLPALAADLVARKVDLIVTFDTPSVRAVKNATSTIPVVFFMGSDPIELGLVASLAHPGGSFTGVTIISGEVIAKRLELLCELVPRAKVIGLLVNPSASNPESGLRGVREVARVKGVQLQILNASTESEMDAAFATLAELHADALVVWDDPFFNNRREQLAALASRHAVPAIYSYREFVVAGGLVCYGASLKEAHRQVGVYAGRILKGEKPANLPVQQPTIFDLVINLKTAKALGLTIPPLILARADEVIE
jgi:putative ABC transport system substrate-binding protein